MASTQVSRQQKSDEMRESTTDIFTAFANGKVPSVSLSQMKQDFLTLPAVQTDIHNRTDRSMSQ